MPDNFSRIDPKTTESDTTTIDSVSDCEPAVIIVAIQSALPLHYHHWFDVLLEPKYQFGLQSLLSDADRDIDTLMMQNSHHQIIN